MSRTSVAAFLLGALALTGCSLFNRHNEDAQRQTGETLRQAAISRGTIPKPTAADAAILTEPVAEILEDAAPEMSAKAEATLERASESAVDAAATVAEPVGAGIDGVSSALTAPLGAVGSGLGAYYDAASAAVSPGKAETQLAFERARSVKKTAKAVQAVFDLDRRTCGTAAAALIAALDPEAEGAKRFITKLLDDPHVEVREAAAHKLVEIARVRVHRASNR